ncbi:helix-turn-helix domain-containing protein [Paramixta manurensis]|uniref:Helix-turn-helix domain-containing protein n=1 Tax=Paramixta manurensis TaxID=2740817 RepID=A0A6M8UBM0_9GAMM|nr:helix-turn-helix domain-containing protein [Erwiniaceae bacterium PD-1]
MIDPLADVVTLLQPAAQFSKVAVASGSWKVRRTDRGEPFYCVVLAGCCRLAVNRETPFLLQEGDFVLIPAAWDFTLYSQHPDDLSEIASVAPVRQPNGEFRIGQQDEPPEVRMLLGHCVFDAPDAALLVSLLPQLIHVRGEPRLTTLVQLVGDESRAQRPARAVVLARLLEVLFIEALRSAARTYASPGLLQGLADERLAAAIRGLHEKPAHPWTVAQMAKTAALSRSTFFERFRATVGVAPMTYLLTWRMALAKDLLRKNAASITEVAERVGYSSVSTFSVAFSRYAGLTPTRYRQELSARNLADEFQQPG